MKMMAWNSFSCRAVARHLLLFLLLGCGFLVTRIGGFQSRCSRNSRALNNNIPSSSIVRTTALQIQHQVIPFATSPPQRSQQQNFWPISKASSTSTSLSLSFSSLKTNPPSWLTLLETSTKRLTTKLIQMNTHIRKLARRMILMSFATFTVLMGTGGGIGSFAPFVQQQHQLCSRFVAHAKYSHEVSQSPTYSLRPGMNMEQLDQIESGDIAIEDIESSSIFDTSTSTSNYEQAKKQQQSSSRSSKIDYGDEDEDDYDDFDDQRIMNDGLGTGIDEREQVIGQKLQSMRTERYAGDKGAKTKGLTAIVAAGFFIPTYGSLIVREYVRRQREERYVQKGLEILEAQKAEYFNVTTTSETNDSDLQDELKDMKNKNETNTDDDDDGDNNNDGEDDDDDQDKRRSSSQPRRPRGDGGGSGGNDGDDGGSSGGGGGGDDAPPSQDDLDRLNRMFSKS